MALWRLAIGEVTRLAAGSVARGPAVLLSKSVTLGALLAGGVDRLVAAHDHADAGPVPDGAVVLSPVADQEMWAAGVTYVRSRDARMYESGHPDSYDLVYEAGRPELFLKAVPGEVRGPGELVGIRWDSTWNVPEPELGVLIDAAGAVSGFFVGNDMSSRSIEGDNALYLPQAKVYDGAAAAGPCIVLPHEAPEPADMRIQLEVRRAGTTVVSDTVAVSDMRRTIPELIDWLYRARTFPSGATLLTGTAIVPDPTFTLESADEVSISITGLGTLVNTVEVVGSSSARAAEGSTA